MTTARTIIRKAMQKAGILSKTEVPPADEANDALDTLNDLFSSIANETLMTHVRSVEGFTLVAGQAEYTIGAGANFDTARPVSIPSAYIRSGNVDYPLTVVADTTYDRNASTKDIQSIPEFFFFDNGFPSAKVTLYPTPATAYQIFLRMEKPLSTLALDTVIELPPGWTLYLTYKLATLLAPEYGQQVDPEIKETANQARENIMLSVAKARTMDAVPIGSIRTGNIYTGWNR